jgi:hypothetical protein
MTPSEHDTLETILRDVAQANHCKIGRVRTEPIAMLLRPGVVTFLTDIQIQSVELVPTGAQCA